MISCNKCDYWLRMNDKIGSCRIGPPVVPLYVNFSISRIPEQPNGVWPTTAEDEGCCAGGQTRIHPLPGPGSYAKAAAAKQIPEASPEENDEALSKESDIDDIDHSAFA